MLPSLWLSILENWENMKKNKEEKNHLFYNYATQRKPLLVFYCYFIVVLLYTYRYVLDLVFSSYL